MDEPPMLSRLRQQKTERIPLARLADFFFGQTGFCARPLQNDFSPDGVAFDDRRAYLSFRCNKNAAMI